jgi:heme exporter protein B
VKELLRQCTIVAHKELLHLWRGRARLVATSAFAFANLVVFSFAGGLHSDALRTSAAGFLWVGILLASTLALAESFRVEVQNNALEANLLLPVHPAAIFYGKAVGNFVLLTLVGVVMVPAAVVLFDATPAGGIGRIFLTVPLGAAAISAPGTMHAALSSRARSRDVLLPLLLFPLIVPGLVAAVQATQLGFLGDAMGDYGDWMTVLAAFCVVQWGLGGLLFSAVVEE